MSVTKVARHRLEDVDLIKTRDINVSFCYHVHVSSGETQWHLSSSSSRKTSELTMITIHIMKMTWQEYLSWVTL